MTQPPSPGEFFTPLSKLSYNSNSDSEIGASVAANLTAKLTTAEAKLTTVTAELAAREDELNKILAKQDGDDK